MDELQESQSENDTILCIDSYVSKQLKLLELERDAEIEENRYLYESFPQKRLQEKGLCIPKLKISQMCTGLFGRLMAKFVTMNGSVITSHSITSGDIVGISCVNSDGKIDVKISGVVSHVHDSYITVALDKDCDSSKLEDAAVFCLIKLANDVTYQRLKRILKTLSKSDKIPLVDVLFGTRSPSSLPPSLTDLKFFNQNLNEDQKDAVCSALSQKEVAVLHGPPGTGKTTTLIECILQCITQKNKVLACAPSNIAVDNLIEKLAPHKIKMVRLGHPARVSTEIQRYCLDSIMSNYDGCDVLKEMQSEMSKLKVKIGVTKGPKKFLWNENKALLKEIKERQKDIVKQIINNADVVLTTLTSASEDGVLKYAEKEHFDICFIDECSQALEIACWIPLVLVKRCVIAGDHNQLPPTIISEKAAKQGLSITLMERLLKLHGEAIKKMLTIQYRMHQTIMQWPSLQLYDNKLVAHESVRSHLLCDIPSVENNEDTSVPLLLIDTDGCDLYELQTDDEESKGNEGEADLVHVHVESLLQSGLQPSDIAIITPYNLQVDLIKSRCLTKYPCLEIKSVDGFQGREKEAVILSLVRSNQSGEVGFLSEDRRINVAITRAKRSLTVICNTRTISHSTFLKSFVSYCEEKGEIRSAHQYANQIGHYTVALKKTNHETKESESKSKKKNPVKKIVDMKTKYFQPKIEIDEVERLSTELKYRDIIQNFIEGGDASYSFSTELSAFERKVVHEISEELGLIHISEGENLNRFIRICKRTTDKQLSAISKENTPDNLSPTEKVQNTKEPQAVKKKKPENLHSNKTSKILSEKDSDDNFDTLISEVMKSDRTCSFNKCKKSVAILSQVCQFCKLNFCFSHFIPEVHGCGHLAKAHARSQIRKDGVIYAGSGKPQKKVDLVKQSYLQKKLNEKISSLTKERKAKPKK